MHPVVIARGHRQLDRAGLAVGKAMAIGPDVVAERGRVDDAVTHQRRAQLLGEFAIRRAIAGRPDAEPALQRLETSLQLLLDPGIAGIGQQMVIAVMADLMAGLEDRFRPSPDARRPTSR